MSRAKLELFLLNYCVPGTHMKTSGHTYKWYFFKNFVFVCLSLSDALLQYLAILDCATHIKQCKLKVKSKVCFDGTVMGRFTVSKLAISLKNHWGQNVCMFFHLWLLLRENSSCLEGYTYWNLGGGGKWGEAKFWS